MKYIFTLLFLFAYSVGYNQIIINGKINNYDGKSKVHYLPTVDGIIPVLARSGKSIIPNPNGSFKIKYENDGFGTFQLHFSGLTFAFFHHEKTEINLVIDQDKIKFPKRRRGDYTADSVKQTATISINGDFAELNRYYNRMIRSSTMTLSVSGCYFSRLVEKIETPAKVIAFIDSLTQIELTQISALSTEINSEKLTPNPVTPEVKKFLENQVHAFYGSIFLSGMMLKRFDQGRKLIAFYSPVLLNAVNKVKNQYPNSQHIALYGPQIEQLKTYLKTTSLQYEKARIVETNYVHFRDLLETFKGKNIFIDVWATWCGPCVDDFNYKSILKPYIDEGKITVLYISIDKPVWKKKWKENMKYNQLEGYHVLADDVLIRDMWNYLGGRQGMIPRYALIDKNGSIYLNNAARPSEGEKLQKQIKGLLGTE